MARTLLISAVIFILLSSCSKEHEIFYPYQNTSLSYLDQLKGEFEYSKYENSKGFVLSVDSTMKISIPALAVDQNLKNVLLKWKLIDMGGHIVGNRLTMKDESGKIISSKKILNFEIIDEKGNSLSLLKTVKICFSESNEKCKLFRHNNLKWNIDIPESYFFGSSNFEYVVNGHLVSKAGYKIETKNPGLICLGQQYEDTNGINSLNVKLSDQFDVSNSIVQIEMPDIKSNVELYWDRNQKSFRLPDGILLPDNNLNIIVFSENDQLQPYFGMKYAVIENGDQINIEVQKTTIETIKESLDSL